MYHQNQQSFSPEKLINDLFFFLTERLTLAQKKQIIKITDNSELLLFLTSSYNCYVITHKDGVNMSLITNPEALFATDNEKSEFLKQVTEYIKQVVIPQIAEKENDYGKKYNN